MIYNVNYVAPDRIQLEASIVCYPGTAIYLRSQADGRVLKCSTMLKVIRATCTNTNTGKFNNSLSGMYRYS